jgi:AcrR family transcriptional regulator
VRAKKRPVRTRRSADEARAHILDVAEKKLEEVGPGGLRLQEIARAAGISHPTILHHFGSREGLVNAVVQRSLASVQRDVLGAFTGESFEGPDAAALLGNVARTLRSSGHARLLTWLALEGHTPEDPAKALRTLAAALHARREAEVGPAPLEDTLFLLVLSSLVVLAEATLGPGTWDSAGLADDPTAPERFHGWLIAMMREHMHGAPASSAKAAADEPSAPKKQSR